MQTKAAPQRSTFEVREDDLSIASESHALLCRAMGAANVEDTESFRETLSPATDPLVVPAMVCGLVEETVVGVAVGAYLVEPNFGFVAYASVDEGWRRMGVYTTLRAKLIDRLRLHGAERGQSDLAYVVSEMESGYFLIRRFVGEDGAYIAPVAYEQPAVQGLETRRLELVVRLMGVSTPTGPRPDAGNSPAHLPAHLPNKGRRVGPDVHPHRRVTGAIEGRWMRVSALIESLPRPGPEMVHTSDVTHIRGDDFSRRSDAELKEAIARIGRSELSESELHEVCAIVAEAIDRRLGAWRLFDEAAELGRLGRYRGLAARVQADAPYRSQLDYYTDPRFLESDVFESSLRPALREYGLSETEQTVVATMVYVAEKSGIPGSQLLLPSEFYRAVRELDSDGSVDFRVTDEQLTAGLALYRGAVVEMDAGEGKTVAAAFPAVLHTLEGRLVHVITANDYLADRDAALLEPVYESLGLTVGALLGHMPDDERRYAYRRQIVYGTLREFGFDFLRDNLRVAPNMPVQRSLEAVIVDEADHSLIDQARTPLIISGEPVGGRRAFAKTRRAIEHLVSRQQRVIEDLEDQLAENGDAAAVPVLARLTLADPDNDLLREHLAKAPKVRRKVASLVDSLELGYDDLASGLLFVVDRRGHSVILTEEGQKLIEDRLGPVFDTSKLERQLAGASKEEEVRLRRRIDRQHGRMNQVHQMLSAYVLLERDVDYVVTEGKIVLVDGLTGRKLPDNRYQHDLHAALEAKEGVEVLPAHETLAQISVPGFIRQYSALSGLTGTALDSADEFRREYGKSVVRVPSAQPSQRTDLHSKIYRTSTEKLDTVVRDVRLCRRVGRPVLLGTVTVEQSEGVSRAFREHRIEHRLLNAVNSASEAEIVRSAGAPGAVTIATNMAGRGTDIIVSPDLDDRIIAGYLSLVRELLAEEVDEVEMRCASDTEAHVLLAAVSICRDLSASHDGPVASVILRSEATKNLKPQYDHPAEPRATTLDFGLGLYVIATEINQSRRADRQLRGRTARQGTFGSSRFILSAEDLRRLVRDGRGLDFAGRSVLEGPGVDRLLLRSQRMTEDEDQAHRAYVNEYARVLDAQAVAYYRARREIVNSSSFHDVSAGFVAESAARLVQRHFPAFRFTHYEDQFDGLVWELNDGFGVDGGWLFGSGIPTLASEIGGLLSTRLEASRDAWGADSFDELQKTLFLQAADEMWKGHLADLEGLVMGIPAELEGRASAMSRFAARAFDAYESFKLRTIDAFVSELLTFPLEDLPVKQPDLVEIVEEAAWILEPETVVSA